MFKRLFQLFDFRWKVNKAHKLFLTHLMYTRFVQFILKEPGRL